MRRRRNRSINCTSNKIFNVIIIINASLPYNYCNVKINCQLKLLTHRWIMVKYAGGGNRKLLFIFILIFIITLLSLEEKIGVVLPRLVFNASFISCLLLYFMFLPLPKQISNSYVDPNVHIITWPTYVDC